MTDREVMQQALEALNLPSLKTQQMLQQRDEAIATLRAALEQPEQEPLTEEKIRSAIYSYKATENLMGMNHVHVARAIEQAHGIKGEA